MSGLDKWFFVEKKEEKPPVSKIKGTYIERCLNLNNPKNIKFPSNSLHAGKVGELIFPKVMYDTIMEFWFGKVEELTYSSEVYLSSGTVSGNRIADRLHRAGLTDCNSEKFEEIKLVNEEFGWSGRPDLILDINKIIYYGKATKPKEEPKDVLWKPFEVKETAAEKYRQWDSVEKLPLKYRGQLDIYIYELKERGIIKETDGHFLILSRDNPKNFRVLDFNFDVKLMDQMKNSAEQFWNFIRTKTAPEGFSLDREAIESQIEIDLNNGRKFNKLSGVSN